MHGPMRLQPSSCRYALLLRWTWLGGLLCACASSADELPPPPLTLTSSTLPDMQDVTLYLELQVNARSLGMDIPVRQQAKHFLVRSSDLLAAGVQREPLAILGTGEWLDISAHPGIEVRYDSIALRLDVALPIEWLPEQRFSASRR